jgi:lysophospholipase L1-like esterase
VQDFASCGRSVLLVVALAALTGCDALRNPTDNSDVPAPVPANVMNYTAVGASDAVGIGGSVPCVPFAPCPTGTGYVQLIARRAQSDGKAVTLMNLGIPGAVLSPEIQALGNSIDSEIYSNAIDSEMPFVAKDSTVVTVFLGGNDVNTIGRAVEAGRAGVDPIGYIATRAGSFGQDYRRLLSGIKDRAPQARIVVLNLPNFAALPYANGYSTDRRRTLQRIAVALSAQINSLATQDVAVVDLMCDASFMNAGLYSSDGFHPNDAGYARIADVVYPLMSGGVAATPRASCAQMTLF